MDLKDALKDLDKSTGIGCSEQTPNYEEKISHIS